MLDTFIEKFIKWLNEESVFEFWRIAETIPNKFSGIIPSGISSAAPGEDHGWLKP